MKTFYKHLPTDTLFVLEVTDDDVTGSIMRGGEWQDATEYLTGALANGETALEEIGEDEVEKKYNPGQARDKNGRWTAGNAASLSSPDGGFTSMGGNAIDSGYAVSPYPERSVALANVSSMSRKDVEAALTNYTEKNADLLALPGHAFGGWHDPATGTAYLDVSIIAQKPEVAAKIALDHDQIAYFDFQTFESVTVNSEAKSGQ